MNMKPIAKKEMRRGERHNKILSLAWSHFLDMGYSGATMSKIAEMTGGSKATLWNHFSSKEIIFKSVISREMQQFHQLIFEQLTLTGPVEETLHGFCRNFITRIVSDQGIALRRLITAEALRFPELPQLFYGKAISPLVSMLASYIEKADQGGMLSAPDPYEAAETLISICHGRCFRRKEFGISVPTDRDINADATLAMRVFLGTYSEGN